LGCAGEAGGRPASDFLGRGHFSFRALFLVPFKGVRGCQFAPPPFACSPLLDRLAAIATKRIEGRESEDGKTW
jgi:hypothetical protein